MCNACGTRDALHMKMKEWQYRTDFRELHAEFPELVDKNGSSWVFRFDDAIAESLEPLQNHEVTLPDELRIKGEKALPTYHENAPP